MVAPVVRRILAPLEFTDSSDPDMEYAVSLAAQLGAELVLFAVVDTSAALQLVGHHRARATRAPTSDFNSTLLDDVKAILQRIVDNAAKLGVKALGHVRVSEEVEEQILKEALVQEVDLILVRSKGRSGFMKALLGSTAGDILQAAPCPVLVARS